MTNEKKSCNWNIVKYPYKQFSHSTYLYEIEKKRKLWPPKQHSSKYFVWMGKGSNETFNDGHKIIFMPIPLKADYGKVWLI